MAKKTAEYYDRALEWLYLVRRYQELGMSFSNALLQANVDCDNKYGPDEAPPTTFN